MASGGSSFSRLVVGLLIGAAVTGFAMSVRNEFLLGQIAAVALGLGSLHGMWRGGFRKIVMMVAFATASYLGARFHSLAAPLVKSLYGSPSILGNYIVTIAVMMLCLVFIRWMVERTKRRSILTRPWLAAFDRVVGAIAGLSEGMLLVLSICWLTTAIGPRAATILSNTAGGPESARAQLSRSILRLSAEAKTGVMADVTKATNPIDSMPGVRAAIDRLNRTGELRLDELGIELPPELSQALQGLAKEQRRGLLSNPDAGHLPQPGLGSRQGRR